VEKAGNAHEGQVDTAAALGFACATGAGCAAALVIVGSSQVANDVGHHCSGANTVIDGGMSLLGLGMDGFATLGEAALEGSPGFKSFVHAQNGAIAGGGSAVSTC
jgi:hypothetical protein